jgi:hypothetical protein
MAELSKQRVKLIKPRGRYEKQDRWRNGQIKAQLLPNRALLFYSSALKIEALLSSKLTVFFQAT